VGGGGGKGLAGEKTSPLGGPYNLKFHYGSQIIRRGETHQVEKRKKLETRGLSGSEETKLRGHFPSLSTFQGS